MKVFKFGGASLKDVAAIRNMGSIVQNYGDMPLVVVVSAMGKTTRQLESLYQDLATGKTTNESLQSIKNYHQAIIEELFGLDDPVFNRVEAHFNKLKQVAFNHDEPLLTYDQIVSHGELISSQIVSAFLNNQDISATLSYAPDFILTSRQFGGGEVDWVLTNKRINEILTPNLNNQIIVTQGYIGGTEQGDVVTLGKEGSDYTAAIIGSCLGADSVTIWKDVPGVLNGDPKLVKNTKQVMKLPYREASEMTYYGASVIHPKTIKPLALKAIPLVVRSFDNPELTPTVIGDYRDLEILPSVIFKKNQCLFSFRVKDYTFVDQFHLAMIFGKLSELNISINLMQNSAISVSVCFDYEMNKVKALLSALSEDFAMHYNSGLELITIKNFDQEAIDAYSPHHHEILLEQKTRDNYRFLVNTHSEE